MKGLSADLVSRVLARLGLSKPMIADLASLQQLYAVWSRFVPFDNTRKLITLHSGHQQQLPGMDARDFSVPSGSYKYSAKKRNVHEGSAQRCLCAQGDPSLYVIFNKCCIRLQSIVT